jgi:hypothetical protein
MSVNGLPQAKLDCGGGFLGFARASVDLLAKSQRGELNTD